MARTGVSATAKGTDRQVWIAGGVGVAPFLSWLRGLEEHPPPRRVDFFYTSDGEAPFAEEIEAIAGAHDGVHTHLIDTERRGTADTESVLATVDGDAGGLSVFLCGPKGMLRTFQTQTSAGAGALAADPSGVLRLAMRLAEPLSRSRAARAGR